MSQCWKSSFVAKYGQAPFVRATSTNFSRFHAYQYNSNTVNNNTTYVLNLRKSSLMNFIIIIK